VAEPASSAAEQPRAAGGPGAPDALVLDLVEWVAKEPRLYADVLDAWRTSCPRLTVWEDAVERGLVERTAAVEGGVFVVVTERGRAFLQARGRTPPPP
jgi:hypothetical protein